MSERDDVESAVHLAGIDVTFGNHLRQRCSWCGYVLIDQGLTRVAYEIDPENPDAEHNVPVWGIGAFVEVTDSTFPKAYWTVEAEVADDGRFVVPEKSCLRIPPELTLSVGEPT